MKWEIFCGMLVAAALLTGCIGHKQYRYFRTDDIPKGKRYLPVLERASLYQLAFVEFKDDGTFWDQRQEPHAVKLVSDVRAVHGRNTIVFLYVHGWHNNADRHLVAKKKDVEKFKDALEFFGRRMKKDGDNVPRLIGIYVAWRGGSMQPDAVKWTSYWNRRSVARTVGTTRLPQFLANISAAAKGGDNPAKVFFTGHSFGARVLEMAMHDYPKGTKTLQPGSMGAWESGLKTSTYDRLKATTTRSPRAPADLVLYINAATRSTLSRDTKARMQEVVVHHPDYSEAQCSPAEMQVEPVCREYPLYIAITSSSDAATGILLPTANLVIPEVPLKPHLRSAANTPSLRTHEVVEVECPATANVCADNSTAEFCFRTAGDAPGCWEVRKLPGAQGAYWILSVNDGIIRDHGDVWNTNLINLVMNMILQAGVAQPDPRQIYVHMPAGPVDARGTVAGKSSSESSNTIRVQ